MCPGLKRSGGLAPTADHLRQVDLQEIAADAHGEGLERFERRWRNHPSRRHVKAGAVQRAGDLSPLQFALGEIRVFVGTDGGRDEECAIDVIHG